MQVYWPALLVGLIVGVYWARVLRMVFKFRRTTGRAANFVPPEPLGRFLRLIWYPTVVLWIGYPLFTAFVRADLPVTRFLHRSSLVAWLGVLVAVAALAATLVCWRRMGTSWRMGIDPGERTQLVVTGPYA